jgi:hypothetical protein
MVFWMWRRIGTAARLAAVPLAVMAEETVPAWATPRRDMRAGADLIDAPPLPWQSREGDRRRLPVERALVLALLDRSRPEAAGGRDLLYLCPASGCAYVPVDGSA